FILATTEPHKLPVTVLSRCQKFEFRRITVESTVDRLNKIADAQNINLDPEASRLMARMADGALRDAISLLDQCMSMGQEKISYQDVISVVGIVNDTFISDVVNAVTSRDMEKLLCLVDRLVMDGKDILQFVQDLVLYYRNLLICKISKTPGEVVEASGEMLEIMKKQGESITREEGVYIIKELSALEPGLKWSSHPRILLEVSLVRICENYINPENHNLLERLSVLERKVNSSSSVPEAVPIRKGITENPPKPYENANEKKTIPKKAEKTDNKKSKSVSASKWNDILKELKSLGRIALYTNLLGTKAVELDNGAFGIIFSGDNSFNKMLVSKAENIGVLENLVSKAIGREVIVKCLDEDSCTFHQSTQKEEKDDFLQKAEDLAKKLDIPLNIIDE
ncbi:MAG: DNA polymerase III subunit gamma/tau, partial [Firmicutes bacterium]|nr:DNA polymerase III subunit gamma/tau [Bacillota bacterium]